MTRCDFEQAMPIANRTAQIRASVAVQCGFVPSSDLDDLIQEGLIACWRAYSRFDPARASCRTYFEYVVGSRLATVIRSGRRMPRSVELDSAAELRAADTISSSDFGIALQRLLLELTAQEQRLVRLLLIHSPAEAARVLGVARSTLHDQIRRLRPKFLAAGLAPARLLTDRRGE